MKKILGLNRYQVELRSYEEEWNKIFIETKEILTNILIDYDLSIEHVGSTSINNLESKPIIDIAIGLSNFNDADRIKTLLEKNDFIFRGDNRNDGEFLFVKEIEQDVRTHHIHVMDKNSEQWRNYIYFRDKLRSNKKLREEYRELKRKLCKQFADQRGEYLIGKAKFIERVLAQQ